MEEEIEMKLASQTGGHRPACADVIGRSTSPPPTLSRSLGNGRRCSNISPPRTSASGHQNPKNIPSRTLVSPDYGYGFMVRDSDGYVLGFA